jgi:hypothetical protein
MVSVSASNRPAWISEDWLLTARRYRRTAVRSWVAAPRSSTKALSVSYRVRGGGSHGMGELGKVDGAQFSRRLAEMPGHGEVEMGEPTHVGFHLCCQDVQPGRRADGYPGFPGLTAP